MGSFFFYGLVLVTSADIWRRLLCSNEAESEGTVKHLM